ncbi:uncharacterized protein MELLADRAFT_114450 [Melampsora larici-populina 98AG31]|uniref:Uncharacterized protein n=1 Tax=Melampsora larici-populina (strain 98AG31 / pathotype 3-4-7) TaxID=747676 RepID=F4SDI6_MELLP|nr:uncharacterized protein MELLADRAFT_114450 [Melampsora larici-populina 98AG31]EGF97291.1 hypothetical protein MELLADRAFT_114450 [Melampsora larici-populina 98AG31]
MDELAHRYQVAEHEILHKLLNPRKNGHREMQVTRIMNAIQQEGMALNTFLLSVNQPLCTWPPHHPSFYSGLLVKTQNVLHFLEHQNLNVFNFLFCLLTPKHHTLRPHREVWQGNGAHSYLVCRVLDSIRNFLIHAGNGHVWEDYIQAQIRDSQLTYCVMFDLAGAIPCNRVSTRHYVGTGETAHRVDLFLRIIFGVNKGGTGSYHGVLGSLLLALGFDPKENYCARDVSLGIVMDIDSALSPAAAEEEREMVIAQITDAIVAQGMTLQQFIRIVNPSVCTDFVEP